MERGVALREKRIWAKKSMGVVGYKGSRGRGLRDVNSFHSASLRRIHIPESALPVFGIIKTAEPLCRIPRT